ncbi:MAG: tandem-95 repeat protein, partial [Planctomycetes bacterium]|nr:tandem-95 repeat protein [Planctomycetota bacterium]
LNLDGSLANINRRSIDQTVGITVTPVNDAPIQSGSVALSGQATEDIPYTIYANELLASFFDIDGETLSIAGEVTADHGIVTDNLDGTYTFTPDADYNGVVTFSFSVSDGSGTDNSRVNATQTLTVIPVDDAPRRVTGTIRPLIVSEDDPTTSLGLENIGYNPGGSGDFAETDQTISYQITRVPNSELGYVELASGEVVIQGGSYTLNELQGMRFAPEPGKSGADAFTFTVRDSNGNEISETVNISVRGIPDQPLRVGANNFNLTIAEDAYEVSMGLQDLAYQGDYDASSGTADSSTGFIDPGTRTRLPLTFDVKEIPSANFGVILGPDNAPINIGTITLTTLQSLRFRPKKNVNSTAYPAQKLVFEVSDGVSSPLVEVVTINVIPVNDAPELASGTPSPFSSINEDNSFSITAADLLIGFSDAESSNA